MDLRIQVDKRQYANLRGELKRLPNGARKAMVSALNKTIPGVRTDAVKAVTSTYAIKAKDARSTMTIRKANKNDLRASLNSRGDAIPLINFQVSPKRATGRRPKSGLMVRVRKSGGGRLRHAFMVSGGRYQSGVYQRKDARRFPIKRLFGPAVPSMLKDAGAEKIILGQASARLAKNLDHEVERLLKGYGK